jgi:hypothetical protein
MRPALALLALLLVAACASAPPVPGPPTRKVVTSMVEVRIPADPYTPTARAIPVLHHIASRICGPDYRIVDRRIGRDTESALAYHPGFRIMVPAHRHSWAIVARLQCLREIH